MTHAAKTLVAVAISSVCLVLGAPTVAVGQSGPTFTKNVAPILYKNCIVCHRPGEVAPMSLITYQDARPWAKAIKDKVVSREMPPWSADPQYGKFKNDRALSQADINTVVAWADSGAPKGDDKDLPAMPKFATGWQNGREPDAIVEMPIPVELPAEGEIENVNYYTTSPFKDDVFAKAIEVRPGVQAAVHHGAVNLVEKLPEGSRIVDGRVVDEKGALVKDEEINKVNGLAQFQENTKLLSYVPGRGYEEYQGGAGQRIKAGSFLRFGMHYQATGKPEVDRTRMGLYLAKQGEVTHQIFHYLNLGTPTYLVEGKELLRDDSGTVPSRLPPIPPYVEDWKVVSVYPIDEPITLWGLTPHLHLRGKSMKYTVTYPDGREEVLLNVPKFDFNWQIYYEFETPAHLPAGSKMTVRTAFDNSLKNKYNPAPEKEVYWSEQSWDEMYEPQFRFTVDSRDLRKPKTAWSQQQQQQ